MNKKSLLIIGVVVLVALGIYNFQADFSPITSKAVTSETCTELNELLERCDSGEYSLCLDKDGEFIYQNLLIACMENFPKVFSGEDGAIGPPHRGGGPGGIPPTGKPPRRGIFEPNGDCDWDEVDNIADPYPAGEDGVPSYGAEKCCVHLLLQRIVHGWDGPACWKEDYMTVLPVGIDDILEIFDRWDNCGYLLDQYCPDEP